MSIQPDAEKPVSPLFEKLNPPYVNPEQAQRLFKELLADKETPHPVIAIGNPEFCKRAHYRLFRTASLQEIQAGALDELIGTVGSDNILLVGLSKTNPCSVYVRDYTLDARSAPPIII